MAGDIREIDMPKATDMNNKKIRLVGDDGQGYWAEIKDFAPVVGGLIRWDGEINSIGLNQIETLYSNKTTVSQSKILIISYNKGCLRTGLFFITGLTLSSGTIEAILKPENFDGYFELFCEEGDLKIRKKHDGVTGYLQYKIY